MISLYNGAITNTYITIGKTPKAAAEEELDVAESARTIVAKVEKPPRPIPKKYGLRRTFKV